jgi:hypothetical protein
MPEAQMLDKQPKLKHPESLTGVEYGSVGLNRSDIFSESISMKNKETGGRAGKQPNLSRMSIESGKEKGTTTSESNNVSDVRIVPGNRVNSKMSFQGNATVDDQNFIQFASRDSNLIDIASKKMKLAIKKKSTKWV